MTEATFHQELNELIDRYLAAGVPEGKLWALMLHIGAGSMLAYYGQDATEAHIKGLMLALKSAFGCRFMSTRP